MRILKQSHRAKKCKWGDPVGFVNTQFVAKYQKVKGDALKTLKIFGKISASAEKIE